MRFSISNLVIICRVSFRCHSLVSVKVNLKYLVYQISWLVCPKKMTRHFLSNKVVFEEPIIECFLSPDFSSEVVCSTFFIISLSAIFLSRNRSKNTTNKCGFFQCVGNRQIRAAILSRVY